MMADNCPFDVSPFAQSAEQKNPPIINLNYTNQNFWSMKSRLIDFIKARFGPNGTEIPNTFNDFVESSIAIMMVEVFAFIGDTLSFKIDQNINEIYIDTVTERENAFRIANLVGFRPTPPIAARTKWSATINNPLLSDIEVPTPLQMDVVTDGTPIKIELYPADSDFNPIFDQNIIIPAGKDVNQNIVGLEGRTITEQFSGTGETGQTLQLGFSPVIFDSIRIQVDGVTWEEVFYFTDSQPRREFRTEIDSQNRGFVIFGNNRAGLIPSNGSTINVTYRVGGGVIGNIVSGFVQLQQQVFVPGLSYSVPVTFQNYTRGEFGYDGDTIDDIRRKLPAWLKTQDRAVTGTDYKTLCEQFATPYQGQIGKANAVLRNHGCAGNIVDIYILAVANTDELEPATNDLKVALIEELNQKKMLTDFVCIRDGIIIDVDTAIDITLDKSYRKFEPEIRVNVTSVVNSFFSLNNWDYGKSLKEADLIKMLASIKQISSVDMNFTTNDPDNSGSIITTRFFEIIRPDSIEINFLYN